MEILSAQEKCKTQDVKQERPRANGLSFYKNKGECMKGKNLFKALWLALVLLNISVAYAKPAQMHIIRRG